MHEQKLTLSPAVSLLPEIPNRERHANDLRKALHAGGQAGIKAMRISLKRRLCLNEDCGGTLVSKHVDGISRMMITEGFTAVSVSLYWS